MNTKSAITGTDVMSVLVAILVCLATLPAVCQSDSKYQVATITAVERNRDGEDAAPDPPSYDLSIRVDRTIYVVRYRSEFGLNTVEYAVGRDLLVPVGENYYVQRHAGSLARTTYHSVENRQCLQERVSNYADLDS